MEKIFMTDREIKGKAENLSNKLENLNYMVEVLEDVTLSEVVRLNNGQGTLQELHSKLGAITESLKNSVERCVEEIEEIVDGCMNQRAGEKSA